MINSCENSKRFNQAAGPTPLPHEYDVDTILLLSDGAPSKLASGAYQDALAQQIYQLCRQHAEVPVNTIGLGNYFDQEMSAFLRTVANITGGEFRGE